MIRATSILRRAAVRPERVVDTLVLAHAARSPGRAEFTGEGGLAFTLDLPRASTLDEGDALRLEDGRLVQVKAAPERLFEVTAATPARLARIAWHLGGRHVATEFAAETLYVAHDPALRELLRGSGATVAEVDRPFRPEQGTGDAHRHDGHDHDHHHVHGGGCGCGETHAHDQAAGGHAHGHQRSG